MNNLEMKHVGKLLFLKAQNSFAGCDCPDPGTGADSCECEDQ